jgi:hypothetical protein
MILQRILQVSLAVRSASANCAVKGEREEMGVTTASTAVKTSASAQKGAAETALKAMWKRTGIKPATAETHLRKCLCFNSVNGVSGLVIIVLL